ncbi:hypothetical protein ASE64_01720 [Agreia sp. Leaf210]|nr:hypothetical protein ASE64_01720 [Agreia sp. Leaf210]
MLAITAATFVFSPTQAANAQAGYRVCGAWNSASAAGVYGKGVDLTDFPWMVGTGLVVKVANGGKGTCESKLGFMKTFYGQAYDGTLARRSFSMVTCENFGNAIGGQGWDPCSNLEVNKIYKYTSRFDEIHPVKYPGFQFWNN